MIQTYFYSALSYLLGSIPFGLVFSAYFKKKDIRNLGSGNIGATNVSRVFGKKLGATILALDLLKGALVPFFCKKYEILPEDICFLVGSFAVIGHVFPVWLRFKGGKGVATSLGMLIAYDMYAGVIFATIWMMAFLLLRYSSLSSVIAQSMSTVILFIEGDSTITEICSLALTVLIIFKHKKNFIELRTKSLRETKHAVAKKNTQQH